ncbi:MAG: 3-methyl-2-oxobutanoate dehydrogenase subunit VorB [Thermodesulfobacteriota bacterium]
MSKVLMKGNEAIAEAAVRAGCLNYFAYPITPQSEIGEYLARRLPEAGGMFLQAESEVAVVYMLYGAAGCGARALTSSSSPGVSLMSEGISYLVGAQLPVVFVNIMRGGPGLGGILPSQADYFQAVKGAGHGDCRMFVLAPASVQEAADMTADAFDLADKYRNPVMVLGDGLIGQMMEPVSFKENKETAMESKHAWATTGMAARGGKPPNRVKSLHLDPAVLNQHNLNLKAKYERMAREDMRWDTYNDEGDYQVLIVSFGTMSRVCRTAVDMLKAKGIETALLRPKTLFPFPEEPIAAAADKACCRAVLSVEMNMGQMVEDVKRSVGREKPVSWYGKCGGEVPTPEEVAAVVEKLISDKEIT